LPELAIIYELQQRIALYEDIRAYENLYNLLSGRLQRFCFSFVKSEEAAEELVSDVFIKLWQIRSRLAGIENLKVYLYTIAKNFCLNYITKNYKHPVVSLEELDIEPLISQGNPEDSCVSADMLQKIRQFIQQLPPQCRLIFRMVREDGLQYREVAEILQVSVLTVRNQVAIATRKIALTLPAYISGTPSVNFKNGKQGSI
jgi:RNA polymerase sigma-70 factor (ECF subfamily)